jgi:potassium-transporting ATPase potassium-binding subunit
MPWIDTVQLALFLGLLTLLVIPVGTFMAHVFEGERTFADPLLKPVEKVIYRITGVKPDSEMTWTTYAIAFLIFNFFSFLALYATLRLQALLPFNPLHLPAVPADTSFNVAVSMITHTNWQSYSGEQVLSNFSQMAGVMVQQFMAAANSLAVALVLIRSLARKETRSVGNYWVDLTRSWLYILLPLAVVGSLFLVSQGTVQTLAVSKNVTTIEGAVQTLRLGPVATQEWVHAAYTQGGGFFNANAAHPFEDPNPLTNFIEMLTVLLFPAAGTYMFGRMVKNQRQGWALFMAMLLMYLASFAVVYSQERAGNPLVAGAGANIASSATQPGGNMEGKEMRNGILGTTLYQQGSTTTSYGGTNGSIDSYLPLAGGMTMFNIATGEVIWGGIGQGLFSMLVFVMLTVFIAGLMVGRTPEYLGKKIQAREMKIAMIALLAMNVGILAFTAISVSTPAGLAGRLNMGPHGLSEIMYSFVQGLSNNGSAMGGLSSNTPFYNTMLGLAMLVGRFLFVVPVFGIAGSFVTKKSTPPSAGTFPTDGALFVILLIGVIVIVGALSFLPAFSLGPVLEHVLLHAGRLF